MEGKRWRTLGQNRLYRNPWITFRVDEVMLPDGETIEYGVLESGGFASVVPVTVDGNIVLVRQWRHPLGRFTLELPSGGIDEEEDPRSAAHRELLEETGYRAKNMDHLLSVHTSTGRTNEVCHLFRCRVARDEAGPRPDSTEFIEVVEIPFEEALKKALSGEISDAPTALGLVLVARSGCGPDALDIK